MLPAGTSKTRSEGFVLYNPAKDKRWQQHSIVGISGLYYNCPHDIPLSILCWHFRFPKRAMEKGCKRSEPTRTIYTRFFPIKDM
jgi:hypothetical protein